jgi:hypothetical protein
VGDDRQTQDQHKQRSEDVPKLTLAGRLEGTLSGGPVEIVAEGRELLIVLPSLSSAWRVRRFVDTLLPSMRQLRRWGVLLRVQIGARWTLQVLPKPHFLIRLALPGLK